MSKRDNPPILLTSGTLSTTPSVKKAMFLDGEEPHLSDDIRRRLVKMAGKRPGYTAVLMPGSATLAIEAVLGTALPKFGGKLLIAVNGTYGGRIVQIARSLEIEHAVLDFGEICRVDPARTAEVLEADPSITHVALVHCETSSGMLNPLAKTVEQVRRFGKTVLVDAVSTFGGIPMDLGDLGIDFLVSSSGNCIQGVPGVSFVICREEQLALCENNARSFSLDLWDQWRSMERTGRWRFTPPTHILRAFHQALLEHDSEGGIAARYDRLYNNQRILAEGMARIGFKTLLPKEWHSPIVTSFFNPVSPDYDFSEFRSRLQQLGYLISPAEITAANCFAVGTAGDVDSYDIERFIDVVQMNRFWM